MHGFVVLQKGQADRVSGLQPLTHGDLRMAADLTG
jgi:hypothetical protein